MSDMELRISSSLGFFGRRHVATKHLVEHVRREVCALGVAEGAVEIRTQVGDPSAGSSRRREAGLPTWW